MSHLFWKLATGKEALLNGGYANFKLKIDD